VLGVHDDARQPRRIEQAFFLIEVPRAVLLCHQAALQAVCELCHRALQVHELLVEITAQPRQLLGVAKLLGGQYLIELRGVGVIVEIRRKIARRRVRAPRHDAFVAVVRHVGVGHGVTVHLRALVRLFGAGVHARILPGRAFVVALVAVALVLLLVLAAFLIVLLGLLAFVLAEAEIGKDAPGE